MRIAVISDTHGSLYWFNQAIKTLGDCHYIIHAGDVLYHGPRNPLPEGYNPKELAEQINGRPRILIARGNCDADVDQMVIKHPIQSPYLLLHLGGHKILVDHGYQHHKESYIQRAKDLGVDLFIYGHTHIKELYRDGQLVILNPGSTALPKDDIHSAAVITGESVKLVDISNGQTIKELELL